MKEIIVVGFGGHAKSVIDSLERTKEYRIIGYTDVEESLAYRGYQWLGTDERLRDYYYQGVRYACIGVGYLGKGRIRDRLYDQLKKIGFQLPVIMDPSAVIAKDVSIGEGSFIGKNVIVNADCRIGKLCIINSDALIEHESIVDDFAHVAVRAVACGSVRIGEHSFLGANATVIQNLQIGKNVIAGAGSVIISDLPDHSVAVGNPAKIIRFRSEKV